jgi:DNA-binding GntR family transcriptional regulator
MIVEGREYQTESQVAAEQLRTAIRHGVITPGTRLDIDSLVELLGMSTTPIREALRSLEAEGLLHSTPYRGVWVSECSPEAEAALYDLRAVLEPYAIRVGLPHLTEEDFARLEQLLQDEIRAVEAGDARAAGICNEEWHACIYARAEGTPYLIDFINRLWNIFPWSIAWDVGGRFERSIREHREILDALRAADADLAESLLRTHILSGKTLVVERLRQLRQADGDE